MKPDYIIAMPALVDLILMIINVRAILIDKDATGIRPYFSLWAAIGSGGFVAPQLWIIDQPISAAAVLLNSALHLIYGLLIVFYQARSGPIAQR